jgi:hypothetical protein
VGWSRLPEYVDTEADLPLTAFPGDRLYTGDTGKEWVWNGSAWRESGLGHGHLNDHPNTSGGHSWHSAHHTAFTQIDHDGLPNPHHSNATDHVRSHSVTNGSDHTFPGGTSVFLRGDGSFASPPGGGGQVPRTVLREGALRTWTNQGAGPTELAVAFRTRQDLTGAADARLTFETTTSVAGGTAALCMDYSTDGTTWIEIGRVLINSGVGLKTGAWVPLPAGAKADVWLRMVARSGNATEDPITRNHEIQVR